MVVPKDGAELAGRWIDELRALGFQEPPHSVALEVTPIGRLDRDALVETVLTRLGSKRARWHSR
jgi:hypothetical protein